jgi:hypothetical protein
MKKLFLVTVVALALSAGISFAAGTRIICNDGVATVNKLGYYHEKNGKMSPKSLNAVAGLADRYADGHRGRKLLGVGDVHILVGAIVQNYNKRGEENKYMMDLVNLMVQEGYEPAKTIFNTAIALLR